MDTETFDDYPFTYPGGHTSYVAFIRHQARLSHCGTTRLVNGDKTETYVNSWVPEGEEQVIDIS